MSFFIPNLSPICRLHTTYDPQFYTRSIHAIRRKGGVELWPHS